MIAMQIIIFLELALIPAREDEKIEFINSGFIYYFLSVLCDRWMNVVEGDEGVCIVMRATLHVFLNIGHRKSHVMLQHCQISFSFSFFPL